MIINGGSRSGLAGYTGYLGWHLQRKDTNEIVNIREMRGVVADDLTMALDELAMMGAGSRSQRPLYHANIDWRHGEVLTEAQKDRAVDRLAEELGLAEQPRVVVEHVKGGRGHLHVVWLRIDPETGKAISDSHNFRRHEIAARELEMEFGLDRVQGPHIERDGIERPARAPKSWEFAQAERSGISPAEAKAELTRLWQMADTGAAFAAALDEAGWTLARGDKRDVLVALDPAGETHAINKKLTGLTAAQVRARFADLDAATLPGVDEARQAMRDRQPEAAQPSPEPVAEMEGADVAGPSPEATPGASYEVGPEPPADLEARFGPEPAYVPNFVMVPDYDPAMDARWAPSPEIDPEAGMQIDMTPGPEQLHQLDELDQLGKQRQAKPQAPEAEAGRRQEPAPDLEPTAADNDARRAMEDLAKTDPLGMAARHGFHAGDRLKTPEEMRREWVDRMRSFEPEPEPEPTPEPMPWGRLLRTLAEDGARPTQGPAREMGGAEVAGPSPEATPGASYEVGPEPKPAERSRMADFLAAAREKLASLADRLEMAFARVKERRPEPGPAVQPGRDEAAAAARVETPKPAASRSVADDLLEAGRRRRQNQDPEAERQREMEAERQREQDKSRSIWDDFGKRPNRRPGDPTP